MICIKKNSLYKFYFIYINIIMGNTSSNTKAQYCKFNKTEFSTKTQIIMDAYSVAHYYSNELLLSVMPQSLLNYQNYNELSINYFASRKFEKIPDLIELNPKIQNFYSFHIALLQLHIEYERPELTESEKRDKIKAVFEIAFKIVQILTNELNTICQVSPT
jgi:hypothetical protein